MRTRGSDHNYDLEIIFENHFIPAIQRGFFDQFLSRLKNHYSHEEQKAAYTILDFLSGKPDHITDYSSIRAKFEVVVNNDIDLNNLLLKLTYDEYINHNSRTSEYTFATKLAAHWWFMTRGRR